MVLHEPEVLTSPFTSTPRQNKQEVENSRCTDPPASTLSLETLLGCQAYGARSERLYMTLPIGPKVVPFWEYLIEF